MIEILPETEGNVVGLRLAGKIGASDYEEMLPEFDRIVSNYAEVRIMLDWEDLEGWTEEGESFRFFIRTSYRRLDIKRIAIVGEGKWRSESELMKEIVRSDVRLFDPADREAAWSWLKND